MKLSTTKSAVLALIIANIIWGAAPPIFKWSLNDVGPFTLAFLRFAIAALIFLPITWGQYKIEKRDFLKMFLVAILGITVNITFFFYGLKLGSSINASIIGSAGPVFIVLGSFLFLKEKPKKKFMLGASIGLLGVLFMVLFPFFRDGFTSKLSSIGNIYHILAVLGSVGQTIIARGILKKYLATTVTFWSFTIGAVSFLPFFAYEVMHVGFLPHLTSQGATGIIFGAFLSSALAFYLFYYALRYLPAADVSIFVYIDPVITVLIAIPLLGEIPDLTFIIGAILVFGGIFIGEGRLHWHPLHRLKD
ncbi:MAG: DMT family transporter [Candidatus Levyibacteriota bacterium]